MAGIPKNTPDSWKCGDHAEFPFSTGSVYTKVSSDEAAARPVCKCDFCVHVWQECLRKHIYTCVEHFFIHSYCWSGFSFDDVRPIDIGEAAVATEDHSDYSSDESSHSSDLSDIVDDIIDDDRKNAPPKSECYTYFREKIFRHRNQKNPLQGATSKLSPFRRQGVHSRGQDRSKEAVEIQHYKKSNTKTIKCYI